MAPRRSRFVAPCVAALALTLSLGLAPRSEAQQVSVAPGTQMDGWGKLIRYASCAVNIASSIQRGDNWETSGAWLYCAHLFAEERE